jgi:dihydropteroate synthase
MSFAPRTEFEWQLRSRTLGLGPRTLIMGILNVTPDSFSDGGRHNTLDRAVAHALTLLDEGADILDLGGESTRPNATAISPDEEQSRVLPVLEAILEARPQAVVSIDTFHAATARAAVEAGAEIVNDVSGFSWDTAMAPTCGDLRCGVVLMHSRGTPQTWASLPRLAPDEVLPLVLDGLQRSVAVATGAGIPRSRMVLDPGFGFGKLGDENYVLQARFDQLQQLGLPLLSGTSRKGFLTKTLLQEAARINDSERPAEASRLIANTASNVAAMLAGAHILRVHEPRPAAEAALVADAILKAL